MSKYTTDDFKAQGIEKHGNKYTYEKSVYTGKLKPIIITCPIHGDVELPTAKSHLVKTGCLQCDIEAAKEKRRSGKYSKAKGNRFELKIAQELRDLGYPGVVTSRSESKRFDAKKVDLIDTEHKLPFYPQLKCTKPTPDYFGIREKSGLTDKPFVIFWNKQIVEEGKSDMSSKGEVVILPKQYFYDLLKNV